MYGNDELEFAMQKIAGEKSVLYCVLKVGLGCFIQISNANVLLGEQYHTKQDTL